MDIAALNSLAPAATLNQVSAAKLGTATKIGDSDNGNSFSTVFKSALNMVNETNTLSDAAEKAEIDFSLGKSDNTHDVAIAQQKAYVSLQYTVAVKNALLDAYKEIMQIQI